MALHFDGTGTVALASPWSPTNAANFEVEVEFEFPGDQGYNVFGSLLGKNDNKGALRIGNDKYSFNYEGPGSSTLFKYSSANVTYLTTKKLRAKVVSSTSVELYFDDAGTASETLTLDSGKELVDYEVTHFGSRGGNSEFLPAGAIIHSVKLTDLAAPANSSVYLFNDGSGTTLTDSGALGNNGTLSGFSDLNDAWGIEAPSVTVDDDLEPGAAFTLTYDHYDSAPVSPVTLTDSNDNSVTVAVTVSDTDTAGVHSGTATGTMPDLPSSGTATGLLFGTVTIELGTA